MLGRWSKPKYQNQIILVIQKSSNIQISKHKSIIILWLIKTYPNPCLVPTHQIIGVFLCCLNSVHWRALLLETTVCCCCFGSTSVVRNLYLLCGQKNVQRLKDPILSYIYINTIRTVFDMQRPTKDGVLCSYPWKIANEWNYFVEYVWLLIQKTEK